MTKYIVESKAVRHVLYSVAEVLSYLKALGFKTTAEQIGLVGKAPWQCGPVTVRVG